MLRFLRTLFGGARPGDPGAAGEREAADWLRRERGFEIVAVSYDAASDREKLKKWVADKKVAWPVYFDGKAAEGEFAPKLGVRKAPAAVLFDQKGMLFATNVPPDRFEPAVRQMLGIKEPAPEPQNMNSGGGGGGGGNRRR